MYSNSKVGRSLQNAAHCSITFAFMCEAWINASAAASESRADGQRQHRTTQSYANHVAVADDD